MKDITYDVRIYKTEIYKGKEFTTYTVRWKVASKTWRTPFRKKAQAESFKSALNVAANKGEAFSIRSGRPASWERKEKAQTWYSFSIAYVDAKWPYASPGHRRCIAEALTDVTEALFATSNGMPPRAALRHALRSWAYSGRITKGGDPPEDVAAAIQWLERNTVDMSEFSPEGDGPATVRRVLERISKKLDGMPAAASTATRKRVTFHNALEYACEMSILPGNPINLVKWTRPRVAQTLDLAVVVNSEQAGRLLAAVRNLGQRAERMEAFFATMYFAGLRPEEATDLRRENLVSLPEIGWGEIRLTHANPRSGRRWTDSGAPRERRPLKHRAEGETRTVPVHPDLVRILRRHLDQPGWAETAPNGRVFRGPRGGMINDRA